MKRLTGDQRAEAVRLRQAGCAHREIAALFGVSEKTVQRALKASGQCPKPAAFYKLPPRKRKLVQGMAQGLSPRQAAEAAGYSPATARSAGTDLVGPEEERALAEVLRQEVPASLLAARVREGVDAMETRFFAHEGKVVSTRRVVDFGQRRQYAELAAKLRGDLRDAPAVTVPVQFVFEGGRPAWAP